MAGSMHTFSECSQEIPEEEGSSTEPNQRELYPAPVSYNPLVDVKASNIRTGRACRDTSPLQQSLLYGTLDSGFLITFNRLAQFFLLCLCIVAFWLFLWYWLHLAVNATISSYYEGKKKQTHISFAHFKSVNFIGHPLVPMQWEARHPFIYFLGTFPGFSWFYTYLPYPPSLSVFQAESSKSI